VLRGDIGREVRDLTREICRTLDVEVLQGHIRSDQFAAERAAAPRAERRDAGD